MKMNLEQSKAFEMYKQGYNILLTGPAGTGKSFTLKNIIEWEKSKNRRIGITASTGLAAYLIRGRTIHSFMGIGLAQKPAASLVQCLKSKNSSTYKKLEKLDALIIDEVSMLNAELVDKISDVFSIIRKDSRPFGGVQILLCGDFCQLPPVNGMYCFQSELWKQADFKTIVLQELIRQNGDEKFQIILEELRYGRCDKKILIELKKLKNTIFPAGIQPTRLYSLNVNVDDINDKEHKKMVVKGVQSKKYETVYSLHQNTKNWAESLRIPSSLELCIGDQVVVIWNTDSESSIVNGTRGVVTSFDIDGPVIRLVNGRHVTMSRVTVTCEDDDKINICFIPLKLAYALTIHKSQGMTLDAVEIDLGTSIFEYGQAYTALSRARNLESVKLVDVYSKSFKTHPCVLEFYEKCACK